MRRYPMLLRRGNTYYARVQCPLRLQAMFRHKEVLKSLRTTDFEQAKRLCLAVEAEMRKVFTALDRKVRTPEPVTVARDHQARALAEDRARRLLAPPSDREDEGAGYALTDALERLEDDPAVINRLLERVLYEQGLHVPAALAPAIRP